MDPFSAAILARLPPVRQAPWFDVPLTTTPQERLALLDAIAWEGARDPAVRALARFLVVQGHIGRAGRTCGPLCRCVPAPREVLQGLLDDLPQLAAYEPDPPGHEVLQRVRYTLAPRADAALSPLTGRRLGGGDCKDFSALFAALARALGYRARIVWYTQPGAPRNHVALEVAVPGEGWTAVETTIPGAQLGEDPYTAVARHGRGERVGLTSAHALCEGCAAPAGVPDGAGYWLLRADESSWSPSNAPAEVSIRDAFRAAAVPPNLAQGSGWVGPAPRVTRRGGMLATISVRPSNITTATWLYRIPAEVPQGSRREILNFLRTRLRVLLARTSSDWVVADPTPYAPAVHGTLEWWSSGRASISSSSVEFPALSPGPNENPVGPTTRGTHPTTLGEAAGDAARQVERTSRSLAWIVVPVAGAVGLGYLASLARSARRSHPKETR